MTKQEQQKLIEKVNTIYSFASKAKLPSSVAGRSRTQKQLLSYIQEECIYLEIELKKLKTE